MITAVILAAGGSSRLGTPKQLVQVEGRSLLRRSAETACASGADGVIAVLGHEAAKMRRELEGLRVRVLEHTGWREGIGSSIRAAILSLPAATDGALLMLCDQPRLSTAHLDNLIDHALRSQDHAVASVYGGSPGVPALFPRSLFGELLLLEGDTGAKKVILAHTDHLVTLPWPDGAVDVDAPADVPPEL